jgi:hypothetical protein
MSAPNQDASASQNTTDAQKDASSSQPQTRQGPEEVAKDRTLAEFMLMLDDFEPLVRLHPKRGFTISSS